jgi:zinc-binding alcohol dehydrogenase family protein
MESSFTILGMKAIGYREPLPIDDPTSLLDIELPRPKPRDRDVLVEVKAISVNPVDTKVRMRTGPDAGQEYKVLGWDAAGVVVETGKDTSMFKVGDEVFYAGCIGRQGANAQFHSVDERIVAKKPKTLSFAEAAAVPLTALTAYEMLFDRWMVDPRKAYGEPCRGDLLILGGAGGVGSMMIQMARRLTPLGVIATASRPETQEWCRSLGAHYVIDHQWPIKQQLEELQIPEMTHIALLSGTDQQYPSIVECLAPQGKIGIIDDPKNPVDFRPLKRKCASMHWEYMFARSYYETEDILRQHDILSEVARLIDLGTLKTTMNENLGAINAENLKKAHAKQESGKSIGKTVLEGW